MKKLIFIIFLFLPVFVFSQANQGQNITVNKMKLNGIIYADKSGAIDTLIVVNSDSTGYRYLNVSEPVDSSDAVNLAYFLRYAASKDSSFVTISADTLFIGGDTIVNADFNLTETLFIADSAKYLEKSDSAIFTSVYQNGLKQNIITNLADTSKYIEAEVQVLSISNDTVSLTGGSYVKLPATGIDGTGTANYIPKFSDSNTLADSPILVNGTDVGIGIDPASGYKFEVQDSTSGFMARFINKQVGDGVLIQSGTNASNDIPFRVRLYNTTGLLDLQGNGILNLYNYGDGNITGTPTYYAAFDTNGRLIEVSGAGGEGMTDPMTTAGDIIIRNAANTTTRLGKGSDGQILTLASGVPAWADNSGSSIWSLDGVMNSYKTASEYPLSLLDGQGLYWYTSFPSTLEMAFWESSSGVYSLQAQGYNAVLSARTNGTMDLFGRNFNGTVNALTDDSTKIPTSKAVYDAITAGGAYTNEDAQDAVGTILTDGTYIDFTYTDETPVITATIKANSLDTTLLNDTQFQKYITDRAPAGGGGGTVTSVSSSTTNQLTVANGTTTPALSIVTGAVTNGGTALATGDQIYDFTTGLGYITGNQSITLSGDASGSGTTSITVTVADDSHNHVISNIDNLQDSINARLRVVEHDNTLTGLGTSASPLKVDTTIIATLNDITAAGGYTDEQAQDAVGGMLSDAGDIDFTYTDATPAVTAAIKTGVIDTAMFNGTEVKAYIIEYAAAEAGSGTVTRVISGAGMNFTSFTTTDSIKLGTPSTITGTTTNLVSATSHTHEIQKAQANAFTQGVASFTTNDFDDSSGNISIDYTNGQAANSSTKGFLTSTDWSTFNGKQAAISNLADTSKYIEYRDTTSLIAMQWELDLKQAVIPNLADTSKYIEYRDTTTLIAMQWELDLKQNVIANLADTAKYWERADTTTYLATQYDLTQISGGGQWQTLSGAVAPTTITDEVRIGSTDDNGDYKLQVTGSSRLGNVDINGNMTFTAGKYVSMYEMTAPGAPGGTSGLIYMDSSDDKLKFRSSTTTYDLTATGATSYWEDLTGEIAPADSTHEVLIGTKADNGAFMLQVDGASFFRDDVRIEGTSPNLLLGNSTNNSLSVGLTDGPGEVSLGVSSTGTGGTHTNILYLNPAGSTTLVDMTFSNDVVITDSLTVGRIISTYGIATIDTMMADTTIAAGNLCVLTAVGMELTDADDENRVKGMLGIALESATAGNTGKKFLLKGPYTTSGLTKGATYYISNTPGAVTATRTTTAGDWVRVIGQAKSETILYFDPSPTWIKLK